MCGDLVLKDIVAFSLYKSTDVKLFFPVRVPVATMAESAGMFKSPVFEADLNAASDVVLSSPVLLHLTSSKQKSGIVFEHEFSVSVDGDGMLLFDKMSEINTLDIYILYKRADGKRYLSVPTPGGSSFYPDMNNNAANVATLKMKIISCSFPVEILPSI